VKILKAAALVAIIFCAGIVDAKAGCGPQHREMLNTAVRIDTTGSGTVIYSQDHGTKEEKKYETYILTNYHVISESIRIREIWSPQKSRKIKRETRSPVTAFWFDYIRCARSVGTRGKMADIVAHDEQMDLALLQLRDYERGIEPVAFLLPEKEVPKLGQKVWAVGAGLVFPPFMTSGEMAFSEQIINGYRYQLATSPIIFGNSGGALFARSSDRQRYEMIGVPSRVSAAGFQAVTHMAWSVPTETVYKFLRDNFHGFIVGDKYLEPEDRKPPKESRDRGRDDD
jgi:S1-C subfamily serine protease